MTEPKADREKGRIGQRPLSIRRRMTDDRNRIAAFVDRTGQALANPRFLVGVLALHVLWIAWNSNLFALPRWDPYPFTLLSTIASIEGPMISLMILMRQHRDSRIQEVREELDLDLVLRLNHQVATSAELIESLRKQLHVERGVADEAFFEAVERPDPLELLQQLRQELTEAEGPEE